MPGSKSKEQIAEAYRSAPWRYDLRGFLILTFAYNSSLPRQIRFFGRNLGPRHIEVACGTGTLLELILRWRRWKRREDAEVVGVDYAPSMLHGARRRFAKRRDVVLQHADAAALPFATGSFDTANIANAVHCLPDVEGALSEVFRVLKPGGTLAVNVLLYPRGPWLLRHIAERINRWGIGKGILVTPYRRDDVRGRFLAAGFEIVSEAVSGNCYELLLRRPVEQGR